jgi:DNA modification methylase
MINQIFNHSCESMPELEADRVSLTVTSPPYWNAIDYDIHARGYSEDYRTRAYSQGFSEYSDYLDWLSVVFQEVLRVTKPGGLCAIVVGTVLLDGDHYPVPFDLVARLNREGWDFHQDIIWHKCTAGVKRAGVSIQRPYPGYFYPNIMSEYILIFRKPGPKIFQDRSPEEKSESTFPINRVFTKDVANNIWHIAPIPPGMLDHPAPFPEEIPYRLIQLYSYQDELVLDPFAGSGQTLKVARALGRQYQGYEIIPQYIELANRRIEEPLSIRSQQLVSTFQKVDLNEPITPGDQAD